MIGDKVDEVTTVAGMDADCAAKTVVFRMTVARAIADITAAEWDTVYRNFIAGQCGSAGWRPLIDNGWALSNAYIFADGGTRTFTAVCDAAPPPAPAG